jgi:hypothetical protein
MGVSGQPRNDDGFSALAQLGLHGVALGSLAQSLGEDAQDENEEA